MQTPMNSAVWQLGLVVLVALLASCSACFVRNCPPGGKRSMDSFVHPQRECLRCGPDGLGQCVGPNICCGRTTGCYINTEESAACQKENDVRTPCQVDGDICGRFGEGHCVADGVCCNDEHCELDTNCGDRPSMPDFTSSNIAQKRAPGGRLSPEVVKFLRKLFDHKSYQKRK